MTMPGSWQETFIFFFCVSILFYLFIFNGIIYSSLWHTEIGCLKNTFSDIYNYVFSANSEEKNCLCFYWNIGILRKNEYADYYCLSHSEKKNTIFISLFVSNFCVDF